MAGFKFLLLTIASGLGMILSYNYHFLWFFYFISLLPLLYIIYNQDLKHYKKFLSGFIAGSIMVAGVIWWEWSVLPVDWAGIDSKYGRFLIGYVWGLSSLVGGLVGLWTFGAGYLKKNNWFDFLLIPALWVMIEFFRSLFNSLLWFGDGAFLGPHWSIGFSGYALAPSQVLISFASLGGVYLLSFIAIFVNVVIYFALRDYLGRKNLKPYLKLAGIFLAVITIFNIYYNFSNAPDRNIPVAILTTYQESFSAVSSDKILSLVNDRKELLSQIKEDEENPEVVILPEDSRLLAGLQFLDQKTFIKEIFDDQEVLIIDSARVSKAPGGPVALTFYFLNNATNKLVYSDKQFLVPHGEYMPVISSAILKLFGHNNWIDSFLTARGLSGDKDLNIVEFKDFRLGALACSEVMSVVFNRDLVNQDVAFIVNTASHSLFHGSKLLYDQTINMSKLRAVENNRYYVQSSNFVPSFVISNKGELVNESIWGQEGVIYSEVGHVTKSSFYNKFGRFLLPLLLTVIVLIGIFQKFDYFRKKD